MSDVVIKDRTGKEKHGPDEQTAQWPDKLPDAVLYVDRSRTLAVCQFFVAPDDHKMSIYYRGDRIEPSLVEFYQDVEEEIEENDWEIKDTVSTPRSPVFPYLAETDPQSFEEVLDKAEPSLDAQVVDHLAGSDIKRRLAGNFDPEAAVQVATGSYRRAVQVCKHVLSESDEAAVAITESRNADVVDEADLVFVYETDNVLRPLNPVVLKNGLVDLIFEELSGTVKNIERADARAMGQFYSLSVVRSVVVDDGWRRNYDRNLAHDSIAGLEDTFHALRPPIPGLPTQTEADLVDEVESSMEKVADKAMGEFLAALDEYVGIVENCESLNPWKKLEEVVRCVRILEALEEGDVPPGADPEIAPESLEWRGEHPLLDAAMESGSFDRLADLVRNQERLVKNNDNHGQIEVARKGVQDVAGNVADEMVGRAIEALEKTAEDETVAEKHGRFREASTRLGGPFGIYRNRVYRRLFLQRLGRRFGDEKPPAVNEPFEHKADGSENEACREFNRTVRVLHSHANHDVVAEYLRELEEDVESRQGALLEDFLDSVQNEVAPVVEQVKHGTDESVPGRKIATALDEKFSETRLTVHFEPQKRWRLRLLLGGFLCIGLLVGYLLG